MSSQNRATVLPSIVKYTPYYSGAKRPNVAGEIGRSLANSAKAMLGTASPAALMSLKNCGPSSISVLRGRTTGSPHCWP